jgi:predicted glycoside hydrolase/deacetylase ChbG (UPF0249 family)
MGTRHVTHIASNALSCRLVANGVVALLLGSVMASSVFAETWAERLGFPAEKKVVLLHATELGMCYESNVAGERLLEGGMVRSAAAMAPCPWFSNLLPWCTAHPQADVGLALTLNSPGQNYRWKPVASQGLVSSLTDPDGYFWESPLQTMVNDTPDDVERELEAQIALAKSSGLQPTHLTPYLGTLVTRPDLMEIYLRVARRNWIPAVVVELTPEQVERFAEAGFPMPDDVVQMMADYPLPKVDDLRFVPPGDSYEAKKKAFISLLRNLPAGITQIGFSPAVESEALKQIAPDWQQRVWETQLMSDKDVRQMLQSEDYILTDWREMMDRFQGTSPETGD